MGPRLTAPGVALAALLADAAGLHGLAGWLVLLAVPAACAASFVGVSDALAGLGVLRGVTASLALVLLVVGSAVREHAARGGSIPAVAVSTIVAALICYAIPIFAWILQPGALRTAAPKRRASPA